MLYPETYQCTKALIGAIYILLKTVLRTYFFNNLYKSIYTAKLFTEAVLDIIIMWVDLLHIVIENVLIFIAVLINYYKLSGLKKLNLLFYNSETEHKLSLG